MVVLAGNGDGGGAGAGSGKGGKGKKGAGTGKGENDPNGDGKNANGSGSGSGNGSCCPRCHASQSRGDPIDVVTGRAFTLPIVEVALPGPLPLTISRSYSSAIHDRDVGLGFGWTHSLSWRVRVLGRTARVQTGDGRVVDFGNPDVGEASLGWDGWVLRREAWGYLLDVGDDTWRAFTASTHSPGAGATMLFLMTAIEDRNKNRISLTYDDDRLVEIVDSVGRKIRVPQTRDGRITGFEVKNAKVNGRWVPFSRYEYDESGNLARATDAEGYVRAYAYGSDHLMSAHASPTGLTFHFVYDAEHRCIETWGDYPGKTDPSLSAELSPFLADGRTRAKGVHHVKAAYYEGGYSEITTSLQTERFQGNRFGKVDGIVSAAGVSSRTFDEQGHVMSFVDPLGAKTTWSRDPRGRALAETDPLGRTKRFDRDSSGRITKLVDAAGGVWLAEYDPRGNPTMVADPTGAVTSHAYDTRGLLVEVVDATGARTRFEYDADANLLAVIDANGSVYRAEYDGLGRKIAAVDAAGNTTRFAYNDRGDLLSQVEPNGGIRRYEWDGARHLVQVVDPDGVSAKMGWGGYDVVTSVTKSHSSHGSGGSLDAFHMRYDREGHVVEIHNERGEVHRLRYNAVGFRIGEDTFDGRTLRYRYDPMGRLLRSESGSGQFTDIEYDIGGRVIERRFADGTAEAFEWDANGFLARAKSDLGEWTFARDPIGRAVREEQTFDGRSFVIERTYDALGRRTTLRTSVGHEQTFARDAAGHVRQVVLDGVAHAITNDPLGRELRRVLPGGAMLESDYGPLGELVERRVSNPSAYVPVGKHEPDWVAARQGSFTSQHSYRYSIAGALVEAWDRFRGLTRYENDPIGRLVAFLPEGGPAELFTWDATGNPYEASAVAPATATQGDVGARARPVSRTYGPGNRLRTRGDVEYIWDDDAQLVEKRRPLADGNSESWRYEWTAKGTLGAVERPDGTRVEFAYDPFFRRVLKRVRRGEEVFETRYVWDTDRVVHEVRDRGAQRVHRTFAFEPLSFVPWAHCDESGEWFHYVNDPTGAPVTLVDGKGTVACAIERSAWGLVQVDDGPRTTTPFRYLGQFADDETGLAYNRFRYYDPEIGRFTSADPAGIGAGNNAFRYAPNTVDWLDPWGLGVADALGAAMARERRPCEDGQTPHHIVQRNGGGEGGDRARACLDRNNIGIDSGANGARMWGTAHTQRAEPGHPGQGCPGYHAGNDIHGPAAQSRVADSLEAAERRGGAPAVQRRLRQIGAMQEQGTW